MSTHGNSILRITRDIRDVQEGGDLAIAVAFKDEDVRKCRTLIIGPSGTPYEFGFFEFDIKFGSDYPTKPPQSVKAITTNGGRTRFNPNIYSEGKVCLSILGTWRAQEPGENWSSAQGLESLLWSIQSLMSSNPYANEPGFESTKSTNKDAIAYAAKVHHETLRISVINRLENYLMGQGPIGYSIPTTTFGEDMDVDGPWDPFADMIKTRFLWYYDSYVASIEAARKKHGDKVAEGTTFFLTPFENGANGMNGRFEYKHLLTRLKVLHNKLDDETANMIAEGKVALRREAPVALLFQNHFKALVQRIANSDALLDFEMVDQNPFDWRIILFGKTSTNLEGGIFKIRMVIPLEFPTRQPRVTVETPLFHHRVASRGTLCYVAKSPHEIASHVECIVRSIEDESPTYDPRTLVNPEAAKLLWGDAEQKKVYRRRLRRSAQASSE